MIANSIQSLISAIQREGIDVIIGGGLAVNQHGFSRLTTDADLIVCTEAREQMQSILSGLGFSDLGSTKVSTRFKHTSFTVPYLDLLWTEPNTFSVFLKEAVDTGRDCKVLSLPHLIAMKIHSCSQAQDRRAKDSEDIRWLLKYDPSALPKESPLLLIDRFASEEVKEYLSGLYPE